MKKKSWSISRISGFPFIIFLKKILSFTLSSKLKVLLLLQLDKLLNSFYPSFPNIVTYFDGTWFLPSTSILGGINS